jgi:hypothetical protein
MSDLKAHEYSVRNCARHLGNDGGDEYFQGPGKAVTTFVTYPLGRWEAICQGLDALTLLLIALLLPGLSKPGNLLTEQSRNDDEDRQAG